jgi:hypothetical protein
MATTAAVVELTGWKQLVFEKLPTGEFSNDDVYRHLDEFAHAYPLNQTIPAKVRQVLQWLRDAGLILHVEPGVWRKHETPLAGGLRA